jgi:hypothetical protein
MTTLIAMNRKVLFASMLLALLIASTIPAAALTQEDAKHFLLDIYNPNVSKIIPDLPLIKNVFGNQIIHIIVTKPGGNIELGAATNSEGYITNLTDGAPKDPTLRLKSDEATVDKIINSSDPVKETNEAFKSGKITYEGVSLGNIVIVAILKVVEFFARLFGVI